MMDELKNFEKLWALKGHAIGINEAIQIGGITDKQLGMLSETIARMTEIIEELKVIRDIQ